MKTTNKPSDAETIEALTAKCALLSASLRQAELKAGTAESEELILDDLNQIGTDMQSILSILGEAVGNGTFDHLHSAIEVLTMRSGALSDGIIKLLSGVQVKGSIQNWFNSSDEVRSA